MLRRLRQNCLSPGVQNQTGKRGEILLSKKKLINTYSHTYINAKSITKLKDGKKLEFSVSDLISQRPWRYSSEHGFPIILPQVQPRLRVSPPFLRVLFIPSIPRAFLVCPACLTAKPCLKPSVPATRHGRGRRGFSEGERSHRRVTSCSRSYSRGNLTQISSCPKVCPL